MLVNEHTYFFNVYQKYQWNIKIKISFGCKLTVVSVCVCVCVCYVRMMEVEVGHHTVLLAHSEGKYSAIGNQCTHYGAPLSKGKKAGEEDEHTD